MRTITDHKVNGLNEAIEITAHREPGLGGANYDYLVFGRGENIPDRGSRKFGLTNLLFQNGPIKGIEDMNGITNEALLAVIIDRMRGFQSGQFQCRENAMALTHLEEALMWLQKRTLDRVKRGVEGSLAK